MAINISLNREKVGLERVSIVKYSKSNNKVQSYKSNNISLNLESVKNQTIVEVSNTTGLELIGNTPGQYITVSTPLPPDEFAVSHTLGKVPIGYIICSQNKSGILYIGTSSWTSKSMYFQCDTQDVEFKIFAF